MLENIWCAIAQRAARWSVYAHAPLIAGLVGAAEFHVGPDGAYATVQEGVNAALAAPAGSNEVRVQQGNYTDCVTIPGDLNSGTLYVTAVGTRVSSSGLSTPR